MQECFSAGRIWCIQSAGRAWGCIDRYRHFSNLIFVIRKKGGSDVKQIEKGVSACPYRHDRFGIVRTAVNAQSLEEVMKARGLTQADMLAAAKTYTPTGKIDEYVVFSSGGQSGQVIVYGVPSMRILKYIAVFTPEPWQGYGYGDVESMSDPRGG